jgi:hypothetical protein
VVLLRENKKALLFTTYFPHPLLLILLATPCESRSLFWNRLHYQGVLVSKETYYIYLVSKETCYIYLVSKETLLLVPPSLSFTCTSFLKPPVPVRYSAEGLGFRV